MVDKMAMGQVFSSHYYLITAPYSSVIWKTKVGTIRDRISKDIYFHSTMKMKR